MQSLHTVGWHVNTSLGYVPDSTMYLDMYNPSVPLHRDDESLVFEVPEGANLAMMQVWSC